MGLIFLIYTLAAADRANIGIVLPFVQKEFNMTNTEAGAVISLFFVGYSLAQIPSGFLVRRFGVRAVFPVFMILTSAFTALLGTATSALQMTANRLALGLAEAPLPVSMLSTINRWFPSTEKGTAVGIFLAAAKFGPVLVPPLGALVIASFGWQYIFYFCATPGLLFAVVWYFLVANDPSQSRFTSAAEIQHIRSESNTSVSNRYGKEEQVTSRQVKRRNFDFRWLDRIIRARSIRPLSTATETFKSPHIWGLAVAYLLMTGIINVILAWLPTYLTTVKHLSILNVGFIASAPFIGGVLGNLLGGLISDRILGKRRKPTIIITALSSIFMMYSLVNAPNDPIALSIMLFFTGLLLNLGYSSFTVYPAGLTTKEAYPLAVSVVNTGGQAGGAALPFITGLILDAFSWDAVFLFLAASSLIALAVITFVVEPIKDEKEDHVDAAP
jgi:sugar phosphate permease